MGAGPPFAAVVGSVDAGPSIELGCGDSNTGALSGSAAIVRETRRVRRR